MREFIVGPNDAGQRVDKFLRKALPGLPVSLLNKFARKKKIKHNGKRCDLASHTVLGDRIALYIEDFYFDGRPQPTLSFLAAPSQIAVAYQDDNILIVDKPVGLLCHSDSQQQQDTLVDRIHHYLYQQGQYRPHQELGFAPALCNRIDRNTGGLVLAAKNFETLQLLNHKIAQRQVQRRYLCAVHGCVTQSEGWLRGYHTKDGDSNRASISPTPLPGSKEVLAGYRVWERFAHCTVLEVELITGRTHQIRAQLADMGHPLLGDTKYGAPSRGKGKFQALYAYRLDFCWQGDSGLLQYLDTKQVAVDAQSIIASFGCHQIGKLG